MNERYLFRGKRIEQNQKGEHSWQVGFYFHESDVVNGHVIKRCRDGREFEVDPDTVGQCTGRRDKNETLIFEGDYISFGGEIYLIAFEDACFWIRQADYSMELHTLLRQGDIEIIGNIHDNPELLEVTP